MPVPCRSTGPRAGSAPASGNTSLEALAAVTERLGIRTGLDVVKMIDAAEDVVRPVMDGECVLDRLSLTMGYAGVYSSFLKHADRAAERYGVSGAEILMECGAPRARRWPGGPDHPDRCHAGQRRSFELTAAVEEARIVAGGVDTAYLVAGPSNGPPVVLIHGSGPGVSAAANWRLTIPRLAERFRVIAPDMAGFGASGKPGSYDMALWVDQLVGVFDSLGLARASLVGNSFGGGLALAFTDRHPERVDRLVLMGSVGVPFAITPGLDAVWGYEPSLANMRALLDIFAYDRELVTDELAELRYRASIEPGIQEAFAAMFPAPRQRWVDAMALPDEAIAAISQPTLVVHGRDDRVIPVANAVRLHDLIDRSDLHVFGRCGHWTQIERADDFSALVGRFLSCPS